MQEAQSCHTQVSSVKFFDFSVDLGLSSVMSECFCLPSCPWQGKAITVGGTAWYSGTEEASGFLVTLDWHLYSPARSGLDRGLVVMTPRWYLLKQTGCTAQDHAAI